LTRRINTYAIGLALILVIMSIAVLPAGLADDRCTTTKTTSSCTPVTVTVTVTVTQSDTVTQGETITQSETITQGETLTQTETVTTTESVFLTDTIQQFPVAGQAFIFVGAPLGPIRVTKPAGTVSAAWVDSTAAAVIMGMITSPSFSFDINATAIDQGQNPNTGGGQPVQPSGEPFGSMIIMSGGPFVNGPVAYYENDAHTAKAENAPLYFNQYADSGVIYRSIWHSSDDTEIAGSKVNVNTIGNTLDYFVIEAFHDANNNQIMIIYGYTGYGTFAGALYFKGQLFPAMGNTLSDGYQVIKWQDVNGNNLPDPADSFTVVETMNWPIPP
jgi:hypothetical protein